MKHELTINGVKVVLSETAFSRLKMKLATLQAEFAEADSIDLTYEILKFEGALIANHEVK